MGFRHRFHSDGVPGAMFCPSGRRQGHRWSLVYRRQLGGVEDESEWKVRIWCGKIGRVSVELGITLQFRDLGAI